MKHEVGERIHADHLQMHACHIQDLIVMLRPFVRMVAPSEISARMVPLRTISYESARWMAISSNYLNKSPAQQRRPQATSV